MLLKEERAQLPRNYTIFDIDVGEIARQILLQTVAAIVTIRSIIFTQVTHKLLAFHIKREPISRNPRKCYVQEKEKKKEKDRRNVVHILQNFPA